MSETFLSTFLHVARSITHAERGMAVNADLHVLETFNLDQDVIESPQFAGLAEDCLRRAITSGEAVITNNIIVDPSQAPTTNTNFSNLRVIVALPVDQYGAVYLDQHIRDGIVSKAVIERLMRLAEHVLATGQQELTDGELISLFEQID